MAALASQTLKTRRRVSATASMTLPIGVAASTSLAPSRRLPIWSSTGPMSMRPSLCFRGATWCISPPGSTAWAITGRRINPMSALRSQAISIPGGTASEPTTFIGAGVDKTQIYGGYGLGAIFSVNAANVVIEDMELTDHGQCARGGTSGINCSSGAPGISDYASNGIVTD